MRIREYKSRENVTKSLLNSESAAATVIAAVLLLSIIFTIFAVVRIAYVPEWKNDAEQLHMSEVQRDITELKTTVDMITLLQSANSNSSSNEFSLTVPPVSVPIRMGGGEVPILEPSKSSGTLSINTEPCNVTIITEKGNNTSINSGTITYRSNNRQYVDQVFRYENGAVILAQGNRSLMTQFPSLFIINKTGEHNYDVWIQAINISGDPDTISSDTDTSLRLTGNHYNTIPLTANSFEYIITTRYPDAWKSYFDGTFKGIASKAGLNYSTDFILYPTNNYSDICLKFLNGSNQNYHNQYRLLISESVVMAEIGTRNSLYYTARNLPVADFRYNDSHATFPILFTDLSQNLTGWIWDFGDGAISTEQNPVHTYSTAGNYTVKFIGSNANGTVSKTIIISVLKAIPTIKWDNPDDIIYGTPLNRTQLNASASVNGTFNYTPPSGTVLSAGMHVLSSEFTPTDTTNYSTISRNVTIDVLRAIPTITWNNPVGIIYGTALNSTQLNASASVPGTFSYTPSSGTVLSAGTQTLHVDFAPIDSANYTTASKNVTIDVLKACAYITNFNSGTVSVIDTANNTVIATVPVGTNPWGVAVSPDGTKVYVTNVGSNSISVIDTANNTVIATLSGFNGPYGVAVNREGTKVYVANMNSNTVSVIDTTTNTIIATVNGLSNPVAVVVNPAGTRVYVTSTGNILVRGTVSVIDTATNNVIATVNGLNNPVGIAVNPTGTNVYVANAGSNTVSVIDTATNKVIPPAVTVGSQPYGVAITPDGKKVFVTNQIDNTVSVIDTKNNTVTTTVNGFNGPYGAKVNPEGTKVYVANAGNNTVSAIDVANNAVTTTPVAVGSLPVAFGQFIVPPPT